MTPIPIIVGSAFDLPLQARLRGTGIVPAAFAASDVLTCEVLLWHGTLPVIVPAVAWYTASGTQTGYAQGQVLVSGTTAQAGLLEPSLPYTLLVWWQPAADPTRLSLIIRVSLIVSAPPLA